MTKQEIIDCIKETMDKLQSVDVSNHIQRTLNQKRINEAYNILDKLKKELKEKR